MCRLFMGSMPLTMITLVWSPFVRAQDSVSLSDGDEFPDESAGARVDKEDDLFDEDKVTESIEVDRENVSPERRIVVALESGTRAAVGGDFQTANGFFTRAYELSNEQRVSNRLKARVFITMGAFYAASPKHLGRALQFMKSALSIDPNTFPPKELCVDEFYPVFNSARASLGMSKVSEDRSRTATAATLKSKLTAGRCVRSDACRFHERECSGRCVYGPVARRGKGLIAFGYIHMSFAVGILIASLAIHEEVFVYSLPFIGAHTLLSGVCLGTGYGYRKRHDKLLGKPSQRSAGLLSGREWGQVRTRTLSPLITPVITNDRASGAVAGLGGRF